MKRALRTRKFKDIETAQVELTKEMADTLICLDVLKDVFEIGDFTLEMQVETKMRRNLKRIENGEED